MWLAHRARNEQRRLGQKVGRPPNSIPHTERQVHRVQIWQGGDPEWAICMRRPSRPPQRLCFKEHIEDSTHFFDHIRNAAYHSIKSKRPLVDRSRGQHTARLNGYFDFSYPTYISTAAAVVLAAEFERMGKGYAEVPPTVDLDRWNDDVFRKLYQLGFFEIVGITPQRDDVVIEEGDTRTMQIVSTKNADELGKVDKALQQLGDFINPNRSIDDVIIEVLTGLSEAMSNVTNHAYPPDYEPPYPHIGQLWVAATADRAKQALTIVVYDQGVTIPVTYPRINRIEKVVRYLERTLRPKTDFEFQNDGTYIRAAMKHGGSRTDQRHRGKGLPQMMEVIERTGKGAMTVFSRGGWCSRDSYGRLKSGAVPYSVGGTLIEWAVELPAASTVDVICT